MSAASTSGAPLRPINVIELYKAPPWEYLVLFISGFCLTHLCSPLSPHRCSSLPSSRSSSPSSPSSRSSSRSRALPLMPVTSLRASSVPVRPFPFYLLLSNPSCLVSTRIRPSTSTPSLTPPLPFVLHPLFPCLVIGIVAICAFLGWWSRRGQAGSSSGSEEEAQ